MNDAHRSIQELIAAYALDALDEPGRHRAEADLLDHVARCAECAALFRDLRETAADLAIAAEPVAPPPNLEGDLLSAIRAETPVVRAPRRAPWWRQMTAAAAIMAIGLLSGMFLQTARSDRETRLAVSIMSDPTSESATLSGARGSGLVFVAPDGRGVLIARELKEPPKGRVLKLWLMHDGTPVPSVAFTPGDDIVTLRVAPGDYDAAAVTVERDPDVKAPSGKPIYTGALSA